jgi:Ankyrin repeats (3 copies)/Ankyrin repeats (many copies)
MENKHILTLGLLVFVSSQNVWSMQEDPDIHKAVKAGDNALVQELIQANADVNAKDKEGKTALHWVARVGNTEILQCLLDNGANINLLEINGWTALRYAVAKGRLEIVACLITNGADINAKTHQGGYTSLHDACAFGRLEIVKYLINNGADIHAKTELQYGNKTALDSSYGKVREFLQNYGKLEQEANIRPTRKLFKQAIQAGYYGIVKTMLNYKAHLTKKDIALAKEQWLETKDTVYKKIGRLLVDYYVQLNSLPERLNEHLENAQVPLELRKIMGAALE